MDLKRIIRDALKAVEKENSPDGLGKIERRVRDAFDRRLGGIDIFGTEKEWIGGLLRTVASRNSVAIMFHLGGTLSFEVADSGRIFYRIVGGAGGRAFKFRIHSESGLASKKDFFNVGFPYPPEKLALFEVVGGTIARVRSDVIQRVFSIDASLRRVTTDGVVDDVRLFQSSGELYEAVRCLFEELIYGADGEWDDFFLQLNS
jgi:hypothetical protein